MATRTLIFSNATGAAVNTSWTADRNYRITGFYMSALGLFSYDQDAATTDITGADQVNDRSIGFTSAGGTIPTGLDIPLNSGTTVYFSAGAANTRAMLFLKS